MEKDMTLEQAIAHAKEVAANKCDECGKEHAQLAEWLQELKTQRDRVDVLTEQIEIYEAHLKKTQKSLMDVWEERKKAELRLASYEDKTYITEDFLIRNDFEKRIITNGKSTLPLPTYLYCDEVEEITAKCINAEMGIWYVSIGFLDISENDCLAEGIKKYANGVYTYAIDGKKIYRSRFGTPRVVYADLIDRISGKGTWRNNPYVFVYDFKLVK